MRICISSIKNSDFNAIAALTFPVMQEYCQRHGYTFSPHFSYLNAPEIVWKRLDRAIELFNDHDVVVHMDADVLITNLNQRIEDINMMSGEDIATAENGIINDGVFIWGSDYWPARLNQDDVKEKYSSPQDAINSEYGALMNLKHVAPRTMNSIPNGEYGLENPLTEWQPEDFCLHLPGLGNDRRVQVLKDHLPKIIR